MKSFRVPVLFVVLLAFWMLLSWRLDPLFLVLGVLSAAAVTWVSRPLLDATLGRTDGHRRHLHVGYLLLYVVWLLGRLPAGGAHIARIVLDPRIPPRPGIARFRTNLSSPAARTMLATSITMVPGTMTLDVRGNEFTIHAFTPTSVGDLANAATQRRIARIFGDVPDDPPEIVWEGVDLDPAMPTDEPEGGR